MPNSLKFSFPQIVHRLVFELIENEISYSTPLKYHCNNIRVIAIIDTRCCNKI